MTYITVSGNLGTGKTKLVKELAKDLGWYVLVEIPSIFLNQYYSNPKRWAFCNQVDYYVQFLKHSIHIKKFRDIGIIQDRNIVEAVEIFNKFQYLVGYLTDKEYELLKRLYECCFYLFEWRPDILIYLYCPIDVMLSRINARGYKYEQYIDSNHLTTLQELYEDWINSFNICPVIRFNSNQIDFSNKNDRKIIINKINSLL